LKYAANEESLTFVGGFSVSIKNKVFDSPSKKLRINL